jgi:CDP-diacylglycerol--glycerol-3-phosphate 3-phosphatidyltransferase
MNSSGPQGHLTLATRVTIARILAVPVFVLFMVYYRLSIDAGQPEAGFRLAALTVFLAAGISDGIDGYLARRSHQVSRLGTILDPLADKFLVLAALILLTSPSRPALQPQFPTWFTWLVITRDLVLIPGALLVDHVVGHVEVRARMSGKVATALLMASVAWALAGWPVPPFRATVLLAAAATCLSFVQYIYDGIRQFGVADEA